jgi:hypothetical protein
MIALITKRSLCMLPCVGHHVLKKQLPGHERVVHHALTYRTCQSIWLVIISASRSVVILAR